MTDDIQKLIKASIDTIAPAISNQALGLAYHRPESWGTVAQCFENVARKVALDRGRMQFGWIFHHRYVESIPGPGYLFVTHHAVWNAPSGHLIDVTPYPDPKHHPLAPGGSTLFLLDDKAQPITNNKVIAPLPLRFFALNDDEPLMAYVKKINEEEQETCRAIYAGTELPAGQKQP